MNALENEKYLSLTTFRRDGSPVATPVWFVAEDGRLLVWTSLASGKVKRLRRDARVRVAACDFRGNTHGPAWDATARLLADEEGPHVQRLLRRKYPIARRALSGFARLAAALRRTPADRAAYIEISGV